MNGSTVPGPPRWVRLAAAVVGRLPAGRYRVIERLSRRPPPPFLMPMPAEMGGSAYLCDLRDSIAREVCFTGKYGPQETAVVRWLLRPGMTFVDVGANWGYFTLLAAHLVGEAGRVVALEPDPRLFRILGENVERNGLGRVSLVQAAASREAGVLTLAGYDERAGNFGLSRIVDRAATGERLFEVQADTLDRILEEQGVEAVDLLKMDIEGAEGAALAGLEGSLRAGKIRRLLVELHPAELEEQGSSVADVVGVLRSAGYTGFTVDHDPVVTRRTAYGKVRDVAGLLRPLTPSDPLDAWPHQLWLAPGTEPQWSR